MVDFSSNASKKSIFSKNTKKHLIFLTLFRYSSNILPILRTKYSHIYTKFFLIIQPTIFVKNNFNLTCYNMLKHVKYTIFHENLTFLEGFTNKNIKFEIQRKKL